MNPGGFRLYYAFIIAIVITITIAAVIGTTARKNFVFGLLIGRLETESAPPQIKCPPIPASL